MHVVYMAYTYVCGHVCAHRFVYYFIDKVTASESLINLFRGKQDIKGPEFKMQVF